MESLKYPWQSLPSERRGEFVSALAQKFSSVHFSGYKRAEIRDFARKRDFFTPHPDGIQRHKSGRLIFAKKGFWLPVGKSETLLVRELMRLQLLFVREDN